MYYDVCEDPEELQSMVHTGIHQADPPAVSQLKRRLQTLETKRGNICARRAYLRNKKVCASAADMKSFHILWSFKKKKKLYFSSVQGKMYRSFKGTSPPASCAKCWVFKMFLLHWFIFS